MLSMRETGTFELERTREEITRELKNRSALNAVTTASDRDREGGPMRGADESKAYNAMPGSASSSASSRQPMGIPWQSPSEAITLDNLEDVMRYQGWDPDQQAVGDIVREALTFAAKAILRHVPQSARREAAVQHVVSARMDANAAISFRGRF